MINSTRDNLNWNLIQSFLAVVDHGAVARAAEATGVSQPTLSRHIAALEADVGATLFTRGARGSMLTAAGEALIVAARQMQAAAHGFGLIASGQSQNMTGTVRICASELTAAFQLPPMLLGLRAIYPDIQIEVVASNDMNNLLEREADIAIRMTDPGQEALIARRIGDMGIGGYASKEYLARKGLAFTPDTAHQFDWIGYDKNDIILRSARHMQLPLTRTSFAFRCDNQIVCMEAVRDGLGIGFCFDWLAERYPDLVRVLPPGWIPPVPVWLTAPEELRSNPRIRAVYDHLFEQLAPLMQRAPR